MQQDVIKVIRSWEKAIQSGDIEGIVANHSENILMFDVPEPLQAQGTDEYLKTWKLFYEYGKPGPDVFAIEDLKVTAGEDVAFATGLLRIGGSAEPVCRLTLGLKNVDGRWRIEHEHHSSPHKLSDA
jgi:ketosteroid isomerase-like protein